jgi:hypothetical protein
VCSARTETAPANKIAQVLKGQFHDFLGGIYIGRASFRDPALIFKKIVCCVVIELFNIKDPIRLMQKTYLIPVQIGMLLANASKICRIYG